MIRPKLSKTILNKLFHTSGVAGITPEEEKALLVAAGVPANGVSAILYHLAFQNDGHTATGETTQQYNQYKALVNASEWWEAAIGATVTQKYEWTENGTDKTYTYTATGWVLQKKSAPDTRYPKNAYLALFTTMPDENGQNYEEPATDDSGNATTYMRVNLHEAIISGGVCINNAVEDPETGATVLDNCELFVYPEVFGSTWGTIIGFGIMETEEAGSGTPVLWGRLVTPIETKLERVPLFRAGNFKVTLQ